MSEARSDISSSAVGTGASSLTESVLDKVVLVGDVGVGKTSMFLRFKTGEFQETTPSHNPRDGEHQKEWKAKGTDVSVSTCILAQPTHVRLGVEIIYVRAVDSV